MNNDGWLLLKNCVPIFNKQINTEIEVIALAFIFSYYDYRKIPILNLRAVDADHCTWDLDDYFSCSDLDLILRYI